MNTKYINLTSSGAVFAGEGILSGMYVNSTSSGTVKLLHALNLTGTAYADEGDGKAIAGVITPAIGYHNLSNLHATVGVYAWMSGTIDVTFFTLEAN